MHPRRLGIPVGINKLLAFRLTAAGAAYNSPFIHSLCYLICARLIIPARFVCMV